MTLDSNKLRGDTIRSSALGRLFSLVALALTVGIVAGCEDSTTDDDSGSGYQARCGYNPGDGCTSDFPYTCSAATKCYASLEGCNAGGQCSPSGSSNNPPDNSGGDDGGACTTSTGSGIQCQVVANATRCGGEYFQGAYCNQIDCDVSTGDCWRN